MNSSAHGPAPTRPTRTAPIQRASHVRDDGRARGRGQGAAVPVVVSCSDQGVCEPLLVARRRPAAVDDEQPVQLGRHEGVDEIGRVALAEPGPERAGAGQRSGDPTLTLVSLVRVLREQLGRCRVRARRAREDAVDVAAPRVDGDGEVGEASEDLGGVGLGDERADRAGRWGAPPPGRRRRSTRRAAP